MFCSQCGSKVTDNAKFCHACGAGLNTTSGTPKDIFYDDEGRLNWLYRDYERDPSGNYVIKHVFDNDRIIQYYGVDLNAVPKEENKAMSAMNKIADAGMAIAILTGDSDMHENSAELYRRNEPEDKENLYIYYKKVTIVERDKVTGWFFLKHGIDKSFLRVNPEQLEFVLSELMRRCPKVSMGIVRK